MKNLIQLTKAIVPVSELHNRWSFRHGFLIIALASVALLPLARAVIPPPDGGYANGNTAEGEDALFLLQTGAFNTAIGFDALYTNADGNYNTATGYQAMGGPSQGFYSQSYYNTATGAFAFQNVRSGSFNTATGYAALTGPFELLLNGDHNTATGAFALTSNGEGTYNTANGVNALFSNSDGNDNTAAGSAALFSNITGSENTAMGVEALSSNTTASNNTAVGSGALTYNITGSDNTASGVNALFSNDTGSYNTATGVAALAGNMTSNDNTATGWAALNQNTTGADNTATGLQALLSNISGGSNTAIGVNSLYSNTRGSNNIGLGIGAGGALTIGNDNIDIANAGVAGESAKIRIGTKNTHKNTYIAGIYAVTVPRGLGVIVDSSGHLGTTTSSARYKEAIKPMDKASEAILALQPVTFRYKQELDPDSIPQFGLVAEQVEKVNPDLVARDDQGKPYTVRYEAVNAMLLNEFLKEHRKVEEQQTTIAQLKSADAKQEKEIAALTELVKEQAALIRKVSDQVEVSKGRPQLVADAQWMGTDHE